MRTRVQQVMERARRDDERFRSTRRSRGHASIAAARARLTLAGGAVVEAPVRDLSSHGAALLQARSAPDQAFDVGERGHLRIESRGLTLYDGACLVRHATEEQAHWRIGLQLEDVAALDVAALDVAAELDDASTAQSEWAELERAHPVQPHEHIEGLLQAWLDFLDGVEFAGRNLESNVQAQDAPRRTRMRAQILSAWGPEFVARMRLFRETLARLEERAPDALLRAPEALLEGLRTRMASCPFARRAAEKPLGYAGDFELMGLLYRDEAEADSLLGNLLLHFHRLEPGGQAVRNRRDYLGAVLREALGRTSAERVRIANIGCGAAAELVQFLEQSGELGRRCDITLVDQDARAIAACQSRLTPLSRRTGCRIRYVCDPVARLIRAAPLAACLGEHELIYSAGLFDYLEDDVFVGLASALRSCLTDSGRLVIGNMASHNPSRVLMSTFMDWALLHRSQAQLRGLGSAASRSGDVVEVEAEPSGVNLFLSLRVAGA